MSSQPNIRKKVKPGWSHVSEIGGMKFEHADILQELESDHDKRKGAKNERAFEADMPHEDIHNGNRIASWVAENFFVDNELGSWEAATEPQRRDAGQRMHGSIRDVLMTHEFVEETLRWYSNAEDWDFGGYMLDVSRVRIREPSLGLRVSFR